MTPGKFTDKDKKELFKFLKSKGFLSKDEIAKYNKQYGGSEKSAAFKQGFMDMMRKIAAPTRSDLFEQQAIDAGLTQPVQKIKPSPAPVSKANQSAGAGPIESTIGTPHKSAPRLPDGTLSIYQDEDMPKGIGLFNRGVNTYLGSGAGIHTPVQASEIARNFLAAEPTMAAQPYPKFVGDLLLQRGIDALPDPGPGVRQPTPYELAEYARTLADRYSKEDEVATPGTPEPGGTEYHEPKFDEDGNLVEEAWSEKMPDKETTYYTYPTTEALRESFNPLLSLIPGYSRAETIEDKDDAISDLLDSDELGPAAGMSLLHADPKLQDEFARRAWNTATSAVPISVTSAGREPVR